ncbi:MAG: hypothetical protein KKC46_09070 [Proteobacteria bacterium]|nr:hypothetical protein [Pseudomonadota bacterium]
MKTLATIITPVLVLCIVFIAGCSASVFIPKHLSNIPQNELARVEGTGSFKEFRRILSIDGIVTPFGPAVYVSPGEHEVDYFYQSYTPRPQNRVGKCKLVFEAGQKYDVIRLMSMLKDAGCHTVIRHSSMYPITAISQSNKRDRCQRDLKDLCQILD